MTNLKISGDVGKAYPQSVPQGMNLWRWVLLSHPPAGKTLQGEYGCGPLEVLICLELILTTEKQNVKLFSYQMYHM